MFVGDDLGGAAIADLGDDLVAPAVVRIRWR
jgi:hypothetical protein